MADAEAALQRKVLAEAKLFDSDPEATHGLTFPMPQGMTLKALLRDYDTQRTTGRKVRCAVCPSHTPHFRGFVGELDSGQLVLIGIDCGEKYFGEGVWAAMAAKLKREQDELYYRSRVPPALLQIERAYGLLVEWRPALRFWSDFRTRLNSELPTFGKALADAARRNEGRLAREVMTTISVVDANGNPTERTVAQTESFGSIPSPHPFAHPSGEHSLIRAIEALQTANKVLQSKQDLKSLVEAFRVLREGRRLVDDVQYWHRGWLDNASLAWWKPACEWYNVTRGGERLTIRGRRISQAGYGQVDIPSVPDSDTPFRLVIEAWPS